MSVPPRQPSTDLATRVAIIAVVGGWLLLTGLAGRLAPRLGEPAAHTIGSAAFSAMLLGLLLVARWSRRRAAREQK